MVWGRALVQDGNEAEPCCGKHEVGVEAGPVRPASAVVFDLPNVLYHLAAEEHDLLLYHW